MKGDGYVGSIGDPPVGGRKSLSGGMGKPFGPEPFESLKAEGRKTSREVLNHRLN